MAPPADTTTAHMAFFPSPGMGHLIPFLQLTKLLLHRRIISSATLFLPASTSTAAFSLPDTIRLHHLPPITAPADSHPTSPESEIFRSIALSLDAARAALAALAASPLAALVVDPFGLDLRDSAKELGVPVFMYFGTAAMNLLFTFHLSEFEALLADENDEFADSPDPFTLPGCPPLHGRDFGDPFKSRRSPVYQQFLRQIEVSRSVDGILVNTFGNLESGAISALKNSEQMVPDVYPIGPIVGSGRDGLPGPTQEWLDGQPARSVLYVSFGSGGTLSYEQTWELALGLEESGLRFLWVVRCPNDATSCPTYVSGGKGDVDHGVDQIGFLPEGFVDRTRGRGLVVLNWAPQLAVLAHGSTGGFLTHCGWNSALESVMHGVPMIAWPLYAEQRTNAVALSEGIGVAVRPAGERVVSREEVARAARRVMEEGGLRERALELKEEARKALGEGGSSSVALAEFGARLKA